MLSERESELAERLPAFRQLVAALESGHAAGREYFRRMADAAPVMIWTAGTDTLCDFVNKAMLSFRGRSVEQVLGQGWAEAIHPDDLLRACETYLAAFLARQPFQTRFRFRRYDGEYLWVVDSAVPIYDPGGGFAGYAGSGVATRDDGTAEPPWLSAPAPLTERERQVVVLIADGKSTKQIASALGISYKSVDSHRSNVMKKLEIHDVATLVRYAVRHGLVRP